MTDVKQKAREVVQLIKRPVFFVEGVHAAIDALSAANLLHDPEEVQRGKEALEACVAYAEHFNNDPLIPVGKAVSAIGRAELERRKPRPRYVAEHEGHWSTEWVVRAPNGGWAAKFGTRTAEADAKAYADKLNAEEAK